VRVGGKDGLSLADARRQLDELEREAGAGRTVTVDLTWRIAEGGKS
jgi:hypothetical protein